MISKSHIAAINNLPNAKCVAITDIIHEKKPRLLLQKVNCPCFTDAKEMLEKVPKSMSAFFRYRRIFIPDYVSLCAEFMEKATLCEKNHLK
jgi:predicted dehydrogenase